MRLATILLLLGVGIFSSSFTLSPYWDEKLFTERYLALADGQDTEYWKLRDEMLTPKFSLQDYGGTLVLGAIAAFFISRRGGRNVTSPRSRAYLIRLSLALPFLTVAAYVFDLLLAYKRGEFPHWADSMGIPLLGSPVLLLIILLWSWAHLSLLPSAYQPARLSLAVSRRTHWWLLIVAAVTALLLVLCLASGQYWYALPGMGWLYFYLSLAASRQLPHDAEPCGQPDLAHKAVQDRFP